VPISLRHITAALIVAALALTFGQPVARAVPPVGCGKVKAHGKRYSVKAHVLACKSARHWTRVWFKNRHHPSGWVCRSFSRRVTRVRFVCENPSTRSRNDGPQSYSASR
jgi:hypothetical protein